MTGVSDGRVPGRSAMAEYLRRKQLYVAERADRTRPAAIAAGISAALVGGVAGVLAALVGSSGVVISLAAAIAVAVVLGIVAVRFYRIPPEIEAWREDAEGERRTARALVRLQRVGYTVLHDRSLPDSGANIDHLVIGPSGAWLIETYSRPGQLRQNAAGVWAGKVPLRAKLGLVTWMGEEASGAMVAELPGGWQLEVQPVIAFTRADLPNGLAFVDGIVLAPATGVADYVLSAGVVLKPLDVALLVDASERTFPAYEVASTPPSWPALSRLRGLLRR